MKKITIASLVAVILLLEARITTQQQIALEGTHFETSPLQRNDLLEIYDCNVTDETFITETNEKHCTEMFHPTETIETGAIIHYPLKNEYTVYVCQLLLTIKGSHCGYFSIQYPNLDEVEKLTLTRKQCLDLHDGLEITMNHLPLKIDNRKGSVRPFNLQGKLGFNLIQNNVGTTSSTGSCTGERLVFRDTSYQWERAKISFNLTLSTKTLAFSDSKSTPKGLECDVARQVCTYPGGVIAWKQEDCPAKTAIKGTFFRSEDGYIRTASREDKAKLILSCRPARSCGLANAQGRQVYCQSICITSLRSHATGNRMTRAECDLMCTVAFNQNITLKLTEPDGRGLSEHCNADIHQTSAPHFHYTTRGVFPIDNTLKAKLKEAHTPTIAVENKKDLETLTMQVRQQLCKLKVEKARDMLFKAHQQPTSAVFIAPGELGIAKGETLIHQRCSIATATLRKTDKCYQHLPIVYKGQPFFRHSVYGHATSFARETPCSHPPLFYVNGVWVGPNGTNQNHTIRRIKSGVSTGERRITTEINADAETLNDFSHEIDALQHRNTFIRGRLGQMIESSPEDTKDLMGDAFDPSGLIKFNNIAPLGLIVVFFSFLCCCCARCFPERCIKMPSFSNKEKETATSYTRERNKDLMEEVRGKDHNQKSQRTRNRRQENADSQTDIDSITELSDGILV